MPIIEGGVNHMRKISILIPTLIPRLAIRQIQNFRENSVYNHQIIVIDNSNNPHLGSYCQKAGIIYLAFKENLGIPMSYKKAFPFVEEELVFASNDDYWMFPEWDVPILREIDKTFQSGITWFGRSPVMVEPLRGNEDTIYFNAGRYVDDFDRRKLMEAYKKGEFKMPRKPSTSWPHIIPYDVWKELDGFDISFFPGFGADPDFVYRLFKRTKNPNSLLNVPESMFYHFSGSTTGTKFTHLPRRVFHRQFEKKHNINVKEMKRIIRNTTTTSDNA